MAIKLASLALNLAEAQKREHYDGSMAIIAELEKQCDLLKVAPWFPSSNGAYHTYVKAKKLGAGAYVDINGGIPNLSSQTDVETLMIADFEALSSIDDKLLKTALYPQKVRDSEDKMNAVGFIQSWTEKLMYGDGTNSAAFKGLAQLRPKLETNRVFNAGGSGSTCTSAWLIEFGEHAFNFRYPNASEPGLINEDRGLNKSEALDGNGKIFTWDRLFSMRAGVQIYDERAVLRMANIATTGTENHFDVDIAIKMKNALPHRGAGAVWFVNRTVLSQIESVLYSKANIWYSRDEIEGFGPVTTILGIPVMLWDDILDTEDALEA